MARVFGIIPRPDWQRLAWELRRERLKGDSVIAEHIEAALDASPDDTLALWFRDEDHFRGVYGAGLNAGLKLPTLRK